MGDTMKWTTLTVFFIVLLPFAFASGVTMSVNQSDFYFKVGEDAVIPVVFNNTLPQDVSGLLSYTVTQEVNQPGFHFESSNSKSATISVPQGMTTKLFDFGSVNTPTNLYVSLDFYYGKLDVKLDNITIHFVGNGSGQGSAGGSMISHMIKQQTASRQQAAQQMFRKMFNQNINQPKANDLVNHQLPEDSSALKKQIQEQLNEQKQIKKEFERNLFSSKSFQAMHRNLASKGFNLTNASINAVTNDTGSFSLQYLNKNGTHVNITGEMKNGSVSIVNPNDVLSRIRESSAFKKALSKLNGFKEINSKMNGSKAVFRYKNDKNETAMIVGMIKNNTVSVKVIKPRKRFWWWLFAIVVVLIGVLIYALNKPRKKDEAPKEEMVRFDYVSEARKMLNEAGKLFEGHHYKDAYGRANQALRLYFSWRYGLKKEITNDEILDFLKKKMDVSKLKECFDLCSLVEFAKYKPNKKDFDKIVEIAREYIV